METIFFALSNMSGIACASDRDHTLYQLSKKLPLALAVSPTSPIPWDSIIEQYKQAGGPEEKEEFSSHIVNNTKMLTMLLDVEPSDRLSSFSKAITMVQGFLPASHRKL